MEFSNSNFDGTNCVECYVNFWLKVIDVSIFGIVKESDKYNIEG